MKKSPELSSFITVTELAGLLGITRGAIHKKILNGQIRAEKVGHQYLIPRLEVEGCVTTVLTDKIKREIDNGVAKAIKDYGKTLKLLGKE